MTFRDARETTMDATRRCRRPSRPKRSRRRAVDPTTRRICLAVSEETLTSAAGQGRGPGPAVPEGDRQGSAADCPAGSRDRPAHRGRSDRAAAGAGRHPDGRAGAARRRRPSAARATLPPTTSSSCPRAASSRPRRSGRCCWRSPASAGSSGRSSGCEESLDDKRRSAASRRHRAAWHRRPARVHPEDRRRDAAQAGPHRRPGRQGAPSLQAPRTSWPTRSRRNRTAAGTRELKQAGDRRPGCPARQLALLLKQIEDERPRRCGRPSASSWRPTCDWWSRWPSATSAATCRCWTWCRKATSAS